MKTLKAPVLLDLKTVSEWQLIEGCVYGPYHELEPPTFHVPTSPLLYVEIERERGWAIVIQKTGKASINMKK